MDLQENSDESNNRRRSNSTQLWLARIRDAFWHVELIKSVQANIISDMRELISPDAQPALAPLSSLRHPDQRLRILAHQGAQSPFPGNSFPAISRALGVADSVEFDVYAVPRSKDDPRAEIIISHPESYFLHVSKERMNNDAQYPLTLEETRNFRIDDKPLIPTLPEVLNERARRFRETGKQSELHIELKGPGTPEVVTSYMKEQVATGSISYEHFLLTALCYPGDRSRVAVTRDVDPHVRIMLVARGGDLVADGFANYDELLQFARDMSVDTVTITRKFLSPELVTRIKEAGFKVGCFHSRTSDELEAALALDADYVAADFFLGADATSYPKVRLTGSPLFQKLSSAGLYVLRDWIWELGWDCEKSRLLAPHCAAPAREAEGADGVVEIALDGTVTARLAIDGVASTTWKDMSSCPVKKEYLGACDQESSNVGTLRALVENQSRLRTYLSIVRSSTHSIEISSVLDLIEERGFEAVVSLAEGTSASLISRSDAQLSPGDLFLLEECARELIVRSGRIEGMIAFSALNPRHGPKDHYTVVLDSPLTKSSHLAQFAAEQQLNAQMLRSGKTGQIVFT